MFKNINAHAKFKVQCVVKYLSAVENNSIVKIRNNVISFLTFSKFLLVGLFHPQVRDRKRFYHPLLTRKPAIMTQNTRATTSPNHKKVLGLSRRKIKR